MELLRPKEKPSWSHSQTSPPSGILGGSQIPGLLKITRAFYLKRAWQVDSALYPQQSWPRPIRSTVSDGNGDHGGCCLNVTCEEGTDLTSGSGRWPGATRLHPQLVAGMSDPMTRAGPGGVSSLSPLQEEWGGGLKTKLDAGQQVSTGHIYSGSFRVTSALNPRCSISGLPDRSLLSAYHVQGQQGVFGGPRQKEIGSGDVLSLA